MLKTKAPFGAEETISNDNTKYIFGDKVLKLRDSIGKKNKRCRQAPNEV